MFLAKVIGAPYLVPGRRPWIHGEPLSPSSELAIFGAKLKVELVLFVGKSIFFTEFIQGTKLRGRTATWLARMLRERIVKVDSRALDDIAYTRLFVWLSMRCKKKDVARISRSSCGFKGACIAYEVRIPITIIPMRKLKVFC